MKTKINKALLNQAIEQTYSTSLRYLAAPDEFVSLIWDAYRVLEIKQKEDKKNVNIGLLMEIPDVYGVTWDDKSNEIRVKTTKGYRTYKTGRFTMETIVKRVKQFVSN